MVTNTVVSGQAAEIRDTARSGPPGQADEPVLADTYPDAHCELNFSSPFQLLVATVLSAQTTDVRVNLTSPALFAAYPTPDDLAAANPEDVETILKPTGFFRAKTKSVMGLSAALRDRFGGTGTATA